MAKIGVSVIICSYNGAARLPNTLRHLALQQVPQYISWEIIIVDNASTDATADVARSEWDHYNLPGIGFKVLKQSKPGKNYAFKMGVEEAQYEFILTCDDDNWLYAHYIAAAYKIMEGDNSIGALGGCGVFEGEQPLVKEIEDYTDQYVNGPQTWVAAQHWVYGAGSVYKRSAFINLLNNGWEQITSGRQGTKLVCGEDVEICLMIYLCGYKIIADDKLLFRHFVPLKRQTEKYIIDLSFWLSYSNVLLTSYFFIIDDDKRSIQRVMNKWFLGSTVALVKNVLSVIYRRIKNWDKITMKQKIHFNHNYGIWYSLLLNRKKIVKHNISIKELLNLQVINKPIE